MKLWLVLALAFTACGGGGGSKSVTILQQANPNPFRESGCKVSVGDVAFDPAVAATDEDKKVFSFALKQELVVARSGLILDGPPAGGNTFLLRPTLQTFGPGAEAQLQVDVTDSSGAQVLEQIRVTAKASTLRDASGPFGKPLGRYLKSRFCSR
jgi:hypothetical protein